MKNLLLAVVLVASVFALSCDEVGGNYLEGSLTESYELGFDTVRISLFTSDISIEYLDSEGRSVLRATVHTQNGLQTGVRYNLMTQGDLTRDSNLSQLPEMDSGELEFEEVGLEDGSAVQGTFNAVFVSDKQVKMTVRGGFSETLKVVDL